MTMRRSIRIVFLAAISLLLVACGTANKTAKSGDAWKTYQKKNHYFRFRQYLCSDGV